MSLEELERRVQALEDVEAIKRLQARFGQICDEQHYNPEELVKMFICKVLFLQFTRGCFAC